jgi:hypothetical protein
MVERLDLLIASKNAGNDAIEVYRVSILKVEHRQLTLCIQFIGIILLFLYITH